MILPGTAPEKIFDIMTDERSKCAYFINKEMKRVRKIFMERPFSDRIHVMRYTVPSSGNRYIVWFYSDWNRNTIKADIGLAVESPRHGCDFYVYREYEHYDSPDGPPTEERFLIHLIPHFISRYRERTRIGASTPTVEVAARYIFRNCEKMFATDYKGLNRKAEEMLKENPSLSAIQVRDGVCFIEKFPIKTNGPAKATYVKFKSFVPDTMLSDEQMKAVPATRENKERVFDRNRYLEYLKLMDIADKHLKKAENA